MTTIHDWLNLKWQISPNDPKHYIALFKGYINATYAIMHRDYINSLNLTPEQEN